MPFDVIGLLKSYKVAENGETAWKFGVVETNSSSSGINFTRPLTALPSVATIPKIGACCFFQRKAYHGALQIKTMFFQVAEHFFDPHPALIKTESCPQIRQIGCQIPGFFSAYFPMHQ